MNVLSISTFFIFLFLSVVSTSVNADVNAVEATIDKNPVMLDEAIRLTVTADGSAERDAFDSSSLLKDFVVGRTSVSSQTSIVNFNTKRTTVWTTTLFPRKQGTFTIPSLTIEGKSTTPIQVRVIPVQEQSNVARDYFVTTDIDLKDAYLNQQLLYTVKLYLSNNIERGSLQAPEMTNAEITQLGEDKQYTDIVNGKRYQIIERQFAMVPQASGEFTLRGPIFTGEVMAANTNQRFGFFNRTQQINRVGPDITVNIKPIPQGIDYPWLPSEMVRVDEEWPQGDSFVAGEPVTRIVTLTALGVVEEQLPEIPEFYPPNFKLYPDQSTTATVEKDQNLISQRQTSLAIIPTEPGAFVLPEISIPWFNTLTEKTEFATIPARTINVVENTAQQGSTKDTSSQNVNSAVPLSPEQTNRAPNATTNPIDNNETGGKNGGTINTQTSLLYWAITCVIALLWVITLIALLATRKKLSEIRRAKDSASANRNPLTSSHNEPEAFKQLLKAAKQRDIPALDASLNQWLKTFKARNSQFTYSNDSALKAPVDQFYALRFSPLAQQGNNSQQANSVIDALVDAVNTARNEYLKRDKKQSHTLSALYPAS